MSSSFFPTGGRMVRDFACKGLTCVTKLDRKSHDAKLDFKNCKKFLPKVMRVTRGLLIAIESLPHGQKKGRRPDSLRPGLRRTEDQA